MEKTIFLYGQEEIDYLKKKDKILGKAIDSIGWIERQVIPDIFCALINSIVGQQISSKAHQTIWNRFENTLGVVNPENILQYPDNDLQSLGLSYRKVSYIKNLSEKVFAKELCLDTLYELSDEEVSKVLIDLKGIGPWTAEMIMLFSMQRKNILSYGDFGIRKGIQILYGHKEISPEQFEKYRKRYSPYGSVASLYLWAVAGGALNEQEA